MSDPFRTPRIPAREVRRILRRAAELAEDDPDIGNVEKTMTQDERERGAGELGLPASAIARAIGAPGERDAVAMASRSFFLGAPTRILLREELGREARSLSPPPRSFSARRRGSFSKKSCGASRPPSTGRTKSTPSASWPAR